MKTTPNSPSGWVEYSNAVKALVERSLTKKEYSAIMQSYITHEKVEDCAQGILEGVK